MEVKIDHAALDDVRQAFSLTERQYTSALKQATKRTAGSARKIISAAKMDIPDLRRTTAIRKRVKPLTRSTGLWIGLNDLWASEFRGKPMRTPSGINFRGQQFDGAFLVKLPHSRRYRIFRKRADGTLTEVTIPIAQRALAFLEKQVLPELPDALFNHFKSYVEFKRQVTHV